MSARSATHQQNENLPVFNCHSLGFCSPRHFLPICGTKSGAWRFIPRCSKTVGEDAEFRLLSPPGGYAAHAGTGRDRSELSARYRSLAIKHKMLALNAEQDTAAPSSATTICRVLSTKARRLRTPSRPDGIEAGAAEATFPSYLGIVSIQQGVVPVIPRLPKLGVVFPVRSRIARTSAMIAACPL